MSSSHLVPRSASFAVAIQRPNNNSSNRQQQHTTEDIMMVIMAGEDEQRIHALATRAVALIKPTVKCEKSAVELCMDISARTLQSPYVNFDVFLILVGMLCDSEFRTEILNQMPVDRRERFENFLVCCLEQLFRGATMEMPREPSLKHNDLVRVFSGESTIPIQLDLKQVKPGERLRFATAMELVDAMKKAYAMA